MLLEQVLKCEPLTEEIAKRFHQRSDFLFLGRGINYPIALEGALKLKEISYIHAEGYPAGEMKHGPIALIDEEMPIVTIAPDDHVFEKMIGNIQEAKARGGSVIVLAGENQHGIKDLLDPARDFLITVPDAHPLITPVLDGRAAAAALVPHRRPPRLRRRSAEESCEERDGRVALPRRAAQSLHRDDFLSCAGFFVALDFLRSGWMWAWPPSCVRCARSSVRRRPATLY